MRAEIGGTDGNYDIQEEASEDLIVAPAQRNGVSAASN